MLFRIVKDHRPQTSRRPLKESKGNQGFASPILETSGSIVKFEGQRSGSYQPFYSPTEAEGEERDPLDGFYEGASDRHQPAGPRHARSQTRAP